MGLKDVENSIKLYADGCFKEACEVRSRDYSKDMYSFEYILVKNSADVYQLYPKVWCRYGSVSHSVMRQFSKGLYKYWGIKFRNTDEMRCSLDKGIDISHTKAVFEDVKGKTVSLSIFDKLTNPFEGAKQGSCMIAYTYEKMLFEYWGLDEDSYSALNEDDERRYLPSHISEDWVAYQKLYEKAFGRHVGEEYDIVCSSGLKRL